MGRKQTLNDELIALRELRDNHFELCKELHNNMNLVPKELKDKIWDLIYCRYEP